MSLPVASIEQTHELWSTGNAALFLIVLGLVLYVVLFSLSTWANLQHIQDDWANQRCSPLIMPFAGYFGVSPTDNFEFCMGKIFNTHSQSTVGSIMGLFGQFTTLLESIFDSLSSLRTTIASLGGGINVIFQEFTERLSNFFYQLRMTAIRIKMLMGRLYGILFSVMYMGTSGITGMSSFTNTYLFSFLDTFCFPGETPMWVKKDTGIKRIPLHEVQIGDYLLPGHTRVTATFSFYSKGQPMVRLGSTVVSTNHYVLYEGRPVKAGAHPHAIPMGPWDSDVPLYCLNTVEHTIPVENLTFLDYDETPEGDADTMKWIESRINGKESIGTDYPYQDAGFAIHPTAQIATTEGLRSACDIAIGTQLTTGSVVVGVIRREVSEVCTLSNGVQLTPATLYWDTDQNQWKRMGEHQAYRSVKQVFVSFVVVPHSQLELADGLRVRDYMELCSPDAEMHYSTLLEARNSEIKTILK